MLRVGGVGGKNCSMGETINGQTKLMNTQRLIFYIISIAFGFVFDVVNINNVS